MKVEEFKLEWKLKQRKENMEKEIKIIINLL